MYITIKELWFDKFCRELKLPQNLSTLLLIGLELTELKGPEIWVRKLERLDLSGQKQLFAINRYPHEHFVRRKWEKDITNKKINFGESSRV